MRRQTALLVFGGFLVLVVLVRMLYGLADADTFGAPSLSVTIARSAANAALFVVGGCSLIASALVRD